MLTNDIDLHMRRGEHGWSQACLRIDREIHDLRLTHIFGDPLEPLATTAVNLSPEVERLTFEWHDEPGLYRWTFNRVRKHHHLFAVELDIYEDAETFRTSIALQTLKFTVEYRFWKTLILAELTRTELLLRCTPYRDHRSPETFPSSAFHTLAT